MDLIDGLGFGSWEKVDFIQPLIKSVGRMIDGYAIATAAAIRLQCGFNRLPNMAEDGREPGEATDEK